LNKITYIVVFSINILLVGCDGGGSNASSHSATSPVTLEAPEFILKGIGSTLQKDPHTLQESDLQKVESLNLTDEMLSESEHKSNSSFELSLIILK
jgi:hypothetical protein